MTVGELRTILKDVPADFEVSLADEYSVEGLAQVNINEDNVVLSMWTDEELIENDEEYVDEEGEGPR